MGWVVNATPRPLYPRERPGTQCTGGWVGLRADLDGCGKSRLPPGFDPRTAQPVASRYTDCAIPALTQDQILVKFIKPDLWHRSQVWPWMGGRWIEQQRSHLHLLGPRPSKCLVFAMYICWFVSPCACLFDVHLFGASPYSLPRPLWGQPNINYWSTTIWSMNFSQQ